MKKLKKYQKFTEDIKFDNNIEHLEDEEIEKSCQDKLNESIINLDNAIENCINFEKIEEGGNEHHEEREMEIYNRMKEISNELKELMFELKEEEKDEI